MNANVLKSGGCAKEKKPTSPSCPPPGGQNDALKWLVGLLALGGLAGLIFLLMRREKEPPVVIPILTKSKFLNHIT